MAKKKRNKKTASQKPTVANEQTEMRNTVLLIAVLALIAGLLVGMRVVKPILDRNSDTGMENPVMGEMKEMRVGTANIMVEVRNTDAGRELGLSYRNGLAQDQGMLFIYDGLERPLFWMKDMLFDIDIIWINGGEVVDLTSNLKAPTEESPRIQTAVPKEDVDMVLEVPAGFIEAHAVDVGDTVEFTN